VFSLPSTLVASTSRKTLIGGMQFGGALASSAPQKLSTRKVTSEFNNLWSFRQILESQNSKGKIDFFALLYF
jgi:hypothetical protein